MELEVCQILGSIATRAARREMRTLLQLLIYHDI